MKKDIPEDIKLRELFNNKLPHAPQNDWFVKKVMNRLPEKRRGAISIIEIIGYATAILVIFGIEIGIGCSIATTGTITLTDIVWLIALNSTLITVVIAIITPHLRHNNG